MLAAMPATACCFIVQPDAAAAPSSPSAGTLAGSSVLLLSLAWGLSVLVGRCDLNEQGVAVDKKHTRGWDLQHTGGGQGRDEGLQLLFCVSNVGSAAAAQEAHIGLGPAAARWDEGWGSSS
jgi:hypothetical protein